MQPDRWLHVQHVIANVLDVPPADRVAILDTACSDDPDLESTLSGLLPPGAGLRRLFEVPMAPTLATIVRAGDVAERPPKFHFWPLALASGPTRSCDCSAPAGWGRSTWPAMHVSSVSSR